MPRKIVTDPEDTFTLISETLGEDPPTFHLKVLTKRERDRLISDNAIDAMLEGEDEEVQARRITKEVMKDLNNVIPDLSKKITRIDNITVVTKEKGEVHFESMTDSEEIKQVFEHLPLVTDLEIKAAIITQSFLTEEQKVLLT